MGGEINGHQKKDTEQHPAKDNRGSILPRFPFRYPSPAETQGFPYPCKNHNA